MDQAKPKARRVRDGYVSRDELDKRIGYFLRGYGKRLKNQTDKIAYYCQMTAYNAYIEYYSDQHGWTTAVQQTRDDRFNYKLQPFGDPENFSYFELSHGTDVLWVLNNMQIESAHDGDLFFAPDVVVVRANAIKSHKSEVARAAGYERTVYFLRNRDLITFGEVKNVSPFPELLFSFQGLIFELMPEIFFGKLSAEDNVHPAPALLCSFTGSRHAMKIARTLESRFRVNILSRFLAFSRLPDELQTVSAKRRRKRSKGWLRNRTTE